MAAAGQIAATRDEDAEGHVEHLVARRVGRLHWLAGWLLADLDWKSATWLVGLAIATATVGASASNSDLAGA